MKKLLLLGMTLCSGAAAADRPGSDIFDRVAAVVGKAVITQSEVDLMAKIQLVRLGRYEKLVLSRAPELRRKALEYLVNRALLDEEVRRLAFQQIKKGDVDQELESFRSKFPSATAYQDFLRESELTEAALAGILSRSLLVSRFADDSVRLNVRVSDSEIERYLAENMQNEFFAGKSDEEKRELARRILLRQRSEKAMVALLEDLRRRTRVRILMDLK
jgi:hypothetical protein